MNEPCLRTLKRRQQKLYAEVQKILEELYPLGLSIRRVVDLPNGMQRVSYVALPADKLEELMGRFEK